MYYEISDIYFLARVIPPVLFFFLYRFFYFVTSDCAVGENVNE